MKKEAHKFLDLAIKRKTCYEFKDKKVSESDIKKILEAGRWAPSFSNIQPWRFQVITNKKIIEKLVRVASYGVFHTFPPVMIALFVPNSVIGEDRRGVYRGKTSLFGGYMSISMAAQNMLLQATDLKINSALLTTRPDETKTILGLKKDNYVPIFISLGYEKDKAYQKSRTRHDLKKLLLKRIT